MASKLHIGNLSYGSNDMTLRDMFSQAGNVVSATIIMDRVTGRSKGFGFVEMSTEAEAQAAIEMFNGKEMEGRTISVSPARPLEPRAPRQNAF